MSEDRDRRDAARRITREAAALARRYHADLGRIRVEAKGVQDFVTEADREVEALVRARVGEVFPGDGFLGEESGRAPGTGAWVVDPIDGTGNFIRGLATFAVSLAYVDDAGVARVGIIEEPARGVTYAAHVGGGAYRMTPDDPDGERLAVSTVDALDRSLVSLGYWAQGEPGPFVDAVRRLTAHRCDVRRFGSACLALSYVAAGHLEGFWQSLINAWDVAAGIVLVTEAGGRVSPFLASGGMDGPRPILATNAALAEAIEAEIPTAPPAGTP